jgi:hypothetical protein
MQSSAAADSAGCSCSAQQGLQHLRLLQLQPLGLPTQQQLCQRRQQLSQL